MEINSDFIVCVEAWCEDLDWVLPEKGYFMVHVSTGYKFITKENPFDLERETLDKQGNTFEAHLYDVYTGKTGKTGAPL